MICWRRSFDLNLLYSIELVVTGTTGWPHRRLPLPAGSAFLKIVCERSLEHSPRRLLDAAAAAAVENGLLVEVHTESGQDAERIAHILLDLGLRPEPLILCHVDKRPDRTFHKALLPTGVRVEFDTFFRLNYQPKQAVRPLLEFWVSENHEDQILLATDMADSGMWLGLGGQPGLLGWFDHLIPRLQALGFD